MEDMLSIPGRVKFSQAQGPLKGGRARAWDQLKMASKGPHIVPRMVDSRLRGCSGIVITWEAMRNL